MAKGSVKLAFAVDSIKAVEASFVQVNCSCCSLDRSQCFIVLCTDGIKHFFGVLIAFKDGNDFINDIRNLNIDVDQLGIAVGDYSIFGE